MTNGVACRRLPRCTTCKADATHAVTDPTGRVELFACAAHRSAVTDVVTGQAGALKTPEVLSAARFRSNAELIEHVARLGYLRPEYRTLDPTYEKGVWWQRWRPDYLVLHRYEEPPHIDFRDMPHRDRSFDAVAYDPDYCCMGGQETSTMVDYNARYGRDDACKTPEQQQQKINDGLTEQVRVLRHASRVRVDGEWVDRGGVLLVKCANYIWSGRLWAGSFYTLAHAMALGLELVDTFVHVGVSRPQPARTRRCPACRGVEPLRVCERCGGDGRIAGVQQHARQNVSYLYVLRKREGAGDRGVRGSPRLTLDD